MKKILVENEAEKIISRYAPVAKSKLVKNLDGAIKFNKFPCVLKIMSKDALHKTEVGGVKIVQGREDLEEKFSELEAIVKKHKLKISGYLVQEFIEGNELFIGIKKDPVFGHVIVFGMGGIFVELMKDVSIRLCPITPKDAQEMIDDLKMKKVLYGARGKKPVNLAQLKKSLVSMSKLPEKYKDLTELDINPLMANHKEVKVVDARMVFN